ncbi:bifunctional DNA-formamidopyrimidine glycosylase/DNA-(apurinic or apyrimidinic site) lyase [Gordonia sp. ABSL1-1]|uniref:bifunctional DNA-formamidopyrimidine glycosylase/DNA-(apurinic or apyrimidinic site) lyase n=1 Tax=Gordonia sp. ABSL1-1 TaxID=3053923 RepID=UPI0025733ECF|nr:bifunctional DNA-formamidopyrimidine glycosylase/DNA-(apurinic or apyrimidinic site) lyase [Gordonia sp. ABSL1-1]MDL9939014.1 bifunctional DNA-formamidopyrimidine glycosylase/DNA-(apurinic or apyrimidinic site) lyase [Gordonia sp. ABSL1-1]
MPELPEVEVVRRGLERHVVGSVINAVQVLHERPVRAHAGGVTGFVDELRGRRFTAARRRGKYLWLALDDADAMIAHLGMSGQMLVQPVGQADERHLRVRFGLGGQELRFVDQRMFGGLSLSDGGALLPPEIAHIAPDPLETAFDPVAVAARIRRSTSAIKRLLLTQTVVSGVGNIYADESLWRAGLHGERPGRQLTRATVLQLLEHVKDVMAEALEQGGTSFDALYVNVNGESGYFDRSLNAYGQEGRPCAHCGTLIRRSAFMNRSSYFCPVCQKPPRGFATGRRG